MEVYKSDECGRPLFANAVTYVAKISASILAILQYTYIAIVFLSTVYYKINCDTLLKNHNCINHTSRDS